MNRELVTGLAQLSAEKGLPKEVVSDIIARAIKRAYGDEEHIDVKVDVQTGAFKVFLLKTVVEKVEDPKIQVQLDTAKKIKRSEEHTSELQSRLHLVCRLLLEKK